MKNIDALIQSLTECELLLRSVGESFWAGKINVVLKQANGNPNKIRLDEILSWHGGMGSFNDLMISKYNKHLTEGKDEKQLNEALNTISDNIYREAKALSRDK